MIEAVLILIVLVLLLSVWVYRLDRAFHRQTDRLTRAAYFGARLAAKALVDAPPEQFESWDSETRMIVDLIIDFGKQPEDPEALRSWLAKAKIPTVRHES